MQELQGNRTFQLAGVETQRDPTIAHLQEDAAVSIEKACHACQIMAPLRMQGTCLGLGSGSSTVAIAVAVAHALIVKQGKANMINQASDSLELPAHQQPSRSATCTSGTSATTALVIHLPCWCIHTEALLHV